jgi:hypothetical protein
MASAELSPRVGKTVAYPPLCESDSQRRELHETLLDADAAPAPQPEPGPAANRLEPRSPSELARL